MRTTSCGCRYAVDAINAVKAVKSSKLSFLDRDRVGMMGRSMGGNVTMNALVAQPDLVDAAVLYATTSSLAEENWRQFSQDAPDQQGDQPPDRADVRPARRQPEVLAGRIAPALPRPGDRAGPAAPRDGGRHLPAALGPLGHRVL